MHDSHLSCLLKCGSRRPSSCHFGLPPGCKWDLPSSGMLCSPEHSSWTDWPLKMGTIGCTETSETSWLSQFYVPIEVMSNHASYRIVKHLFRGRPRPGVSGVPWSCGNIARLQLLVDAVLLHADHAGCGQRCEYHTAVCGAVVANKRDVNL